MQLHGGIGVTWEHDLHLYLRRATVNRATYGTPEEHTERVAADAAGGGVVTADVESVEDFRLRARAWLADNMPPECDGVPDRGDDRSPGRRAATAAQALGRRLRRHLLPGRVRRARAHASSTSVAFTEESLPYDMPSSLNVPTLGILAATLVDFGTHEQKARHLPAILQGEELWVQFLSEPSGGSDLAGCLTRADRDGDVFVSTARRSGARAPPTSDYAMCLARTNWDVPKHRGLTMFIMKIHQPGVQVEQIRQVDGSMEFCQEFFDDVPIPASRRGGRDRRRLDGRHAPARARAQRRRRRLAVHERPLRGHDLDDEDNRLADLVERPGRTGDAARPPARGRGPRPPGRCSGQLIPRLTQGDDGRGHAAAGRVAHEAVRRHQRDAPLRDRPRARRRRRGRVARSTTRAGRPRGSASFTLWRQGMSLGGGSNEIQRNIISERLLGMPREFAADREVPYRDVPRGGAA